MKTNNIKTFKITVVALGLVCGWILFWVFGSQQQQIAPEASSSHRTSFSIDITSLMPKLGEIPEDDRSDQIADWAVLGTLMSSDFTAEDLRDALFDKSPWRDPALSEVYDFDYGEGRSVTLKNGEVWLFYSNRAISDPSEERSSELRKSILGRLADGVRMEHGEIPSRFRVFSYLPNLLEGELVVTEELPLEGKIVFSPEFGYYEQKIQSANELREWLERIDDVTYVSLEGALPAFAGRISGKGSRNGKASLQDVAALYQAHTEILRYHKVSEEINSLIGKYNKLVEKHGPVNRELEKTIDAYNNIVTRAKLSRLNAADLPIVDKHINNLRTLLGLSPDFKSATSPLGSGIYRERDESIESLFGPTLEQERIYPQRNLQRPGFDGDLFNQDYLDPDVSELLRQYGAGSNQNQVSNEALTKLQSEITDLQDRVEERQASDIRLLNSYSDRLDVLEREWEQFPAQKVSEPGFSLDPRWHTERMLTDLEILREDPSSIVEKAHQRIREAEEADYPESAIPIAVTTAENFLLSLGRFQVFGGGGEDDGGFGIQRVANTTDSPKLELNSSQRGKLAELIRKISNTSEESQQEGVKWLPYYKLLDELRESFDPQDAALAAALHYLETENRYQGARYDGKLQGTRAGMVLFYTDVLAKIWAIDFRRSSPSEKINGFQSLLKIAGEIEPQYWGEEERLPGTRIWFGTKKEGIAASSEDGPLYFAPIATRVYSAGNNPLSPGEEAPPAEASRKMMGWWDRNFERVADYEPMYHAQNQIMKWSVITGMLAEHGEASFLSSVFVDRSQVFNEWLVNEADLKFSEDIRLLSPQESRSFSDTETMEILQSPAEFTLRGPVGYSGGVSLGGKDTIREGTIIIPDVPKGIRRPGMKYQSFSKDDSRLIVEKLDSTKFELPQGTNANQSIVTPRDSARLRAGGVELNRFSYTSEFRSDGNVSTMHLSSEAGELGRLEVQKGAKGLRLDWHEGIMADTRRAARDLAHFEGTNFDSTSSVLAKQPEFLPDKGIFVLELQGQRELLVTSADLAPGRRANRITSGTDPPKGKENLHSNESLAVSSVSRKSALQALLTGEPSIIRISAKEADLGIDPALRLDQATWQRLEALPAGGNGGGSGMPPGKLLRIFSDAEPPNNGKDFKLTFQDTELGAIEGRVVGNSVYLKRPDGRPSQAFNDLVARQRLTGEQLTQIVERVKGEEGTAEIPFGTAEQASPSAAAQAFLERDFSKVADELTNAENLEATVAEVARIENLNNRPLEGQSIAEADLFARAGKVVDIERATTETISSKSKHALDELLQKLEAPEVLPALSQDVIEAFTKAGQVDVVDFLRYKANEGALADQVSMELSGNRFHSILKTRPSQVQKEVLESAEAKLQILEKSPTIYVRNSAILSEADFDFAPGMTISRLMKNPEIKVEKVEIAGLNEFRPTRLVLAGEPPNGPPPPPGPEFVRRWPGPGGQASGAGAAATAYILLLSDEDDNEEDENDADESEKITPGSKTN